FAELLESTFCVTFAVQILIVTVTMSVSLLQIAMQLNEVLEAMRYTLYVITQVIHLFYFSFQGQRLIEHSMQIGDKIYNSSWYNLPVKSQRLLLYVMQRSMQPNFFSAGKIYIFSLKNFTTVIQSAVSYFTVLASFQ
ncbi:PREDICTED: odorant receptor coreceptor-like, partial [Wasmannia auropunctata]|uniref:odorant receptor coreceptor-like n=1 Tax=Wasmannia auropunctata TaxID=64793 RepID=UPI0005EE9634